MSSSVLLEIQMPQGWEGLRLPDGVQKRLKGLLDGFDNLAGPLFDIFGSPDALARFERGMRPH